MTNENSGERAMNWIDKVNAKLKHGNQILFSKDSECLQGLKASLDRLDRRIVILWAFDFADESVKQLAEKYPDENRPAEALEAARNWAEGKVKMRYAQRKILDCHAFAKDIDDKADIAICHAIGQACAVVHTQGHAIGYPMYDLTSIVLKRGVNNCAEEVNARIQKYMERLCFWTEHIECYHGEWAGFILKQQR